jgi:endonuclease/exonuclease/phosphatase (EEP) superfamily protein YafD
MFGLLADIKLSVYVFIFASVFSCFSAISYISDLFCQFRVQMAAGLAFMTVLLLFNYKINKAPKLLALTAASLALNLVCIVWTTVANPFAGVSRNGARPIETDTTNTTLPLSTKTDLPTGQRQLKLLQFNLNNNNREYAKFEAYVLNLKPDVICLEEYSSGWWDNIAAVKKEYPYQIFKLREDSFGVAIFSRYPLQRSAIVGLGKAGVPSAFGQIEFNGQPWSFLVTHPLPPLNRQWYTLRNEQYKVMADFIRKEKSNHFVLAGDLNCAPWSAHFMNFLTASNLRDSRLGFGIQPSWPVNCWLLRIPIDHVLTSQNVETKVRRIEQDLGSDHLPVYVELLAN